MESTLTTTTGVHFRNFSADWETFNFPQKHLLKTKFLSLVFGIFFRFGIEKKKKKIDFKAEINLIALSAKKMLNANEKQHNRGYHTMSHY